MPTQLCRHIKTNGTPCQSPSLRDHSYCFFHDRLLSRHRHFRFTDQTRNQCLPGWHVELTALEDRESIQLSISLIVNAIANGQMDMRLAKIALYGLSLAMQNLKHTQTQPQPETLVQAALTTPDGLDLIPPAQVAGQASEEPSEDASQPGAVPEPCSPPVVEASIEHIQINEIPRSLANPCPNDPATYFTPRSPAPLHRP